MQVVYKVDSRKRTYGEHWRIHWPNMNRFLIAAFAKLLDIPQRSTIGIRRPTLLDLHESSGVPVSVRERLEDPIQACEENALSFQFFASIDAIIGAPAKAYMAALLHADGLAWATAMAVRARPGRIVRPQPIRFNCFSLLPDRRYIATSDHQWKMIPHPGDFVEHMVGAWPDEVVARHQQRIAELLPIRVPQEDLAGAILAREQRYVDEQIRRGVYVPMTDAEVARIAER